MLEVVRVLLKFHARVDVFDEVTFLSMFYINQSSRCFRVIAIFGSNVQDCMQMWVTGFPIIAESSNAPAHFFLFPFANRFSGFLRMPKHLSLFW